MIDLLKLSDPILLKSARQIYLTYRELRSDTAEKPTGVAIHRLTCRGRLLFSKKPILLPLEEFIPIAEIESDESNFY
ncbi:hypothetical protein [Gloeocapsopsis dulcis]|uniref:Uncharacterized protein n=1 Tax=Gloeocapsopsis dulcis AAB1 = 1H9 TaxID=1433147 RepID=A0A6N8FT29_9CHRO|nr:hypothetical protein [Gloeocapsopsis dulcis]MUL35096.1 hypothetical protein [Gloeocapsopsis dulcis AAB1 = 1H9]WNN88978.1 hypothetical protein P0S91_22420 [Gloeocapsopsis dulcis]